HARRSFSVGLERPPRAPLLPYTTLFRSFGRGGGGDGAVRGRRLRRVRGCPLVGAAPCRAPAHRRGPAAGRGPGAGVAGEAVVRLDRKSTRLNSSHVKISYAVFCLKKKTR